MAKFLLFLSCFALFIRQIVTIIVPKPISVEPLTLSAGSFSVYRFAFTVEKLVNKDPSFVLKFPPQFTQTSNSLSCYVKMGGGSWNSNICSKSQSSQIEITIPMTTIEQQNYEISVWEILNPENVPSTANFEISVNSFSSKIEESQRFQGVPFLDKASFFCFKFRYIPKPSFQFDWAAKSFEFGIFQFNPKAFQ